MQSARQQLNDMHSRPSYYLLPRAHAQGVKQSVCLSVVVVVVVFVFSTKIARSRVLGICASSKHNQSVDIGEKLVYTHFELLKKAYQCYKSCIFCSACLWFIDHTHSFSTLIILRMLKLNVGKGRHVIKLMHSVAILRYSGRARGVCALQSSSFWLAFAIVGLFYDHPHSFRSQ